MGAKFLTDKEIDRAHECMCEVAALPAGAVGDICIHPFLWHALMAWHERNGNATVVMSGGATPEELFSRECRTTLGTHAIRTRIDIPIDEVRIRLNLTTKG